MKEFEEQAKRASTTHTTEVCEHNFEIRLKSHVEHVCGKCGFTLGEGVCEHDWQSTLRDTSRCRHCHMWWEELGEERG